MQKPRKKREKIPTYEKDFVFEYNNRNAVDVTDFVKLKKQNFKLTNKQLELIELIQKNKIITVTGPPGTSKTYMACYVALLSYLNKECDKIILCKPTDVLSGTKELGYLPGTLDEKIQVYVESFLDSFDDLLLAKDFKHLWDSKIIEFKPAQFLRGRTLKNSFIIIDEYQNFDIQALRSIVTRFSVGSKLIFLGDSRQNDISKDNLGIHVFNEILSKVDGCGNFTFERKDIVREQILIDIVDQFEHYEDNGLMPKTRRNT